MADRDVDVIQGTLNVLILKTLSRGPMNGYGIARSVRETTAGDIEIEEGALYPALHRMEHREWVAAEWGCEREQSAREVLSAYTARPTRAAGAHRKLGAPRRRGGEGAVRRARTRLIGARLHAT